MKYSIADVYLILKKRISEEEILRIAEVRKEILESKLKEPSITNDQMAISIYFKLFNKISNEEITILNQLSYRN